MRADGSAIEEEQTLIADAGIDLQEPLQALAIEVGSWVKVREDVQTPRYGWGVMSREDRGRVRTIHGSTVTVDFENQNGWAGKLEEIELC